MDPDLEQFLSHLHRGGQWSYWWIGQSKQSIWWPTSKPLPVPAGPVDVYFGVHPSRAIPATNAEGQRKPPAAVRSQIAAIAAVNCVFAEYDGKDFGSGKTGAFAYLDRMEPEPSVIVDSGGGYHAYWLLRDPFGLDSPEATERARTLQAAWVEWAGGDRGAKDLARVLRVPGTRNYKPAYAPECPAVLFFRLHPFIRYDLADLERLALANAAAKEAAPVPTGPPAAPAGNGHSAYAAKALAGELAQLAQAREGGRNAALNTASFSLGQLVGAGLLDRGAVEQALENMARSIGLEEQETSRTIRSGLEKGMQKPRTPAPLYTNGHFSANGHGPPESQDTPPDPMAQQRFFKHTDMGNGERLIHRHGQDLRYCKKWDDWLVWDSRRWQMDSSLEVDRRAKETIRSIYLEAGSTIDDDLRKKIGKHAEKSEADRRVAAMINQARDAVPVQPEDLDLDPWLLNCRNGTIDLRTGDLRPHRREDLITKLVPIDYDPQAQCPIWLAFLNRIMDGNQRVTGFLRRAVGYSLTGSTREQVIFFLWGTGQNGKSTFLDMIGAILADYGREMPRNMLLSKQYKGVGDDVFDLRGARYVSTVEHEEGGRLDEVLVKQLTGGDRLNVRRLFSRDWFEFQPQFKIFLATNHKPDIRGTDYAIWRRIRLIEFGITIPLEEQDKHLTEKMKSSELPGILAWAVRGCLDWQRDELGFPAEVMASTEKYRAEMDVLSDFLSDVCVVAPGARVAARHLYAAYAGWCEENGEKPMTQKMLGLRLTERGFRPERTMAARLWVGLGLAETPYQEELLKSADRTEGTGPMEEGEI